MANVIESFYILLSIDFFLRIEEGKFGLGGFKEIKFSLPQSGHSKPLGFCLENY